MELIGYFFIFFGILGLFRNGPALLTYWRMKNSMGQGLDAEALEQTKIAFAPLSKHYSGLVILSLVGLAIGIYISFVGISVAPATEHDLDRLWLLLAVYAFGFGVTVEAVFRSSKIAGRLVSTELEWQLGGILNALYFALSIWLFIAVIEFIPWWALLPLMLFAVQLGVVAAELLQQRMGPLRGFLFLASPVHLIWSAYILWSL
jgi:hypothetical protein